MLRLIACGGLAAEAAAHATMIFTPASESGSWLVTGALAALPAGYAVLGAFTSVLKEVTPRFDFDPAFQGVQE